MKGSAQNGREASSASASAGQQELKLLTYNIDGLNPDDLNYRTNCVLGIILSEMADVVLLQEVVTATAPPIILTLQKNGYISFHQYDDPASLAHYFTLTFVRKSSLDPVSPSDLSHTTTTTTTVRRIPFVGAGLSGMARDLLLLRVRLHGADWLIANCHLESYKENKEIRVAQLQQGLEELVRHAGGTGPAVLAGDLNIRAVCHLSYVILLYITHI
jgi:endonuclease/exonuclease/phosphatase family metal-dependent hydrolase